MPVQLRIAAVVVLATVAACSDAAPAGGPTIDPSGDAASDIDVSAPADDGTGLLVWTDAGTVEVLRAVAAAFTTATDVAVTIEEVDIDEVRGEILGAGTTGRTPDVFVGEHVWAGDLVESELVVPVVLDAARGQFMSVALQAFHVDGDLYAVPATVESMAMYRNTDLVADAPGTWDELVTACESALVDTCVAVPGGTGDPDAYAQFVFLSAFGGFVFGYDDATGFDAASVGIDAASTIDGAEFLERQVGAGVIPDTGYVEARRRFIDGEAAFWLSGPWELAELAETEIPFEVSSIPRMSGEPARPFVGATGWYVSANSMQAALAASFLTDHVATDDTMREFVVAGVVDSAWSAVARSLPERDPARAFVESAEAGVAIPNIVAVAEVWGPLGERLEQLRRGELDATDALTRAADDVRTATNG
ncbi:MAG: extracellular solute-binding protein [Ilumatobacteraceae bacterium]|nr:extracellular solute-binding protein [Ilumatobacteraceae bacterium]